MNSPKKRGIQTRSQQQPDGKIHPVFYYLAGDQGFEPRLTVPETAVLPLDESPYFAKILPFGISFVKHTERF